MHKWTFAFKGLHRQTRVYSLYDRRKAHLKIVAFSEIWNPGRVQVTTKTTRGGDAPRLIINRAKNRSYERSTEYVKIREWNALRVKERSMGTIETYTKLTKRELNTLLDY